MDVHLVLPNVSYEKRFVWKNMTIYRQVYFTDKKGE